jgi:hypothetical protein
MLRWAVSAAVPLYAGGGGVQVGVGGRAWCRWGHGAEGVWRSDGWWWRPVRRWQVLAVEGGTRFGDNRIKGLILGAGCDNILGEDSQKLFRCPLWWRLRAGTFRWADNDELILRYHQSKLRSKSLQPTGDGAPISAARSTSIGPVCPISKHSA